MAARYSTPASFEKVENNTTFLGPELPVKHPTLGIAGVRIKFAQPLCTLTPGTGSPGAAVVYTSFFGRDGPAQTWPNDIFAGGQCFSFIDINPSLNQLGGPLATAASRYLKYRFDDLEFTVTSAVGTDQAGTYAMCVLDDPAMAAIVSVDFNTIREVVPNVISPYRVPESCLSWRSRDQVLYWIDNPEYTGPGLPGQTANERQTIQATLCGTDSGLITQPPPDPGTVRTLSAGYITVSGTIELFEPIPPTGLPGTAKERDAVKALLAQMRHLPQRRERPSAASSAEAGAITLREIESQMRLVAVTKTAATTGTFESDDCCAAQAVNPPPPEPSAASSGNVGQPTGGGFWFGTKSGPKT
jgi:hypothetical protein